MKDQGLAFALGRLLACSTETDAKEVLGSIGDDYRQICERVVSRLSFKRTLDQNRLYHVWVSEIAKYFGESKEEVARRLKLQEGCAILCRDDPKFLEFCQTIIKPLPHKKRLESMDYISVSSVMTTKQMLEYMDEIEKKYRLRGVPLTIPYEGKDEPDRQATSTKGQATQAE